MDRKRRNKLYYFIKGLILTVCLLVVLLFAKSFPWRSAKRNIHEDSKDLTVPEGMDEFVNNPDVEWMAGMHVLLSGCTLASKNVAENIDTYTFFDGTLIAELEIRNALNREQRFSVMVLADGIVQPFTLDDNQYDQYFLSIENMEKLEIILQPEFSLCIGRLDFLLLYQEETECDFTMMSYTVCIEQPDNVEPVIPKHSISTVPIRKPLFGVVSGDSVMAWLWSTDVDLMRLATGYRVLTCKKTAPIIFEAISGTSSFFVMNLYYNGEIIPVSIDDKEFNELYWNADAGTMISREIEFDHSEEGSFSVIISAPLEWERPPERSWNVKMKVVE
jgi:hypothetical protein